MSKSRTNRTLTASMLLAVTSFCYAPLAKAQAKTSLLRGEVARFNYEKTKKENPMHSYWSVSIYGSSLKTNTSLVFTISNCGDNLLGTHVLTDRKKINFCTRSTKIPVTITKTLDGKPFKAKALDGDIHAYIQKTKGNVVYVRFDIKGIFVLEETSNKQNTIELKESVVVKFLLTEPNYIKLFKKESLLDSGVGSDMFDFDDSENNSDTDSVLQKQ